MDVKKLVKRSVVRRVFHERDVRVPRGFFEEVDQIVLSFLRRIADDKLDNTGAVWNGHPVYINCRGFKEKLRTTLGRRRIPESYLVQVNDAIREKVTLSVERRVATNTSVRDVHVPSGVLRAFLASEEYRSKALSWEKFFVRWQSEDYRREWAAKHEYKGPLFLRSGE